MFEDLKELLKHKQFATLKEAEDFFRNYNENYNSTPVTDLGGLSPIQMGKLIYNSFNTPDSPVVFNKNISGPELSTAIFYQDCKKIISLFQECSPVKTTATGNLTRDFVHKAMDVVNYDTTILRKFCKTINELEFFWLHQIRIILTLAELVTKRGKFFLLTQKGKSILTTAPGELYYLLFETYFLKFNLAYLTRFAEQFPEIQHFICFPIYIAHTQCKDWMNAEEFVNTVLVKGLRLNIKHKDFLAKPYMSDKLVWVGMSRIVNPLYHFGLLEKQSKADNYYVSDKDYIRRTPLLEKFINFSFAKGQH
ncbi:MAG: hypothetical protein WC955_10605 [Elusimicrobiota bacterium]